MGYLALGVEVVRNAVIFFLNVATILTTCYKRYGYLALTKKPLIYTEMNPVYLFLAYY